MELVIKSFSALTLEELYEILRVRMAVFIVEQHCPYQDIDNTDRQAQHLFYTDESGAITAYLRLYPDSHSAEALRMGRVLTMERGTGLGGKLLDEAIAFIKQEGLANQIVIEAQTYARGFYERVGFTQTSEEFLEDDIPHIEMKLIL